MEPELDWFECIAFNDEVPVQSWVVPILYIIYTYIIIIIINISINYYIIYIKRLKNIITNLILFFKIHFFIFLF
jgi:hypothetical protein